MKTILKFDELNHCGEWSCYYPKQIGKVGNQWWAPARALGLAPADYIQLVIDKFHPDHVFFSTKPTNFLVLFSWKKQADMRIYKNWINKQFRDRKFYVEI